MRILGQSCIHVYVCINSYKHPIFRAIMLVYIIYIYAQRDGAMHCLVWIVILCIISFLFRSLNLKINLYIYLAIYFEPCRRIDRSRRAHWIGRWFVIFLGYWDDLLQWYRVEDVCIDGLKTCYFLDFLGPKGFAAELSRKTMCQ